MKCQESVQSFRVNNLRYLFSMLIMLGMCSTSASTKPNVIIIVADDLGWNDVGFHGSKQIPTPNIDALAYSGVILNNYYVQPICTPSRSALMTGYHPVHIGLQSYTIAGAAPYGLPLHFKTLPDYLRDEGYINRHIGKWHLGFYHKEFTPLYRGFDSHFGYWTGRIDYYDHTSVSNDQYWGIDFRRNMTVDRKSFGLYATDLFTEEALTTIKEHNTSSPLFMYLSHLAVHSGNDYNPLQAPVDVVKRFDYIEDKNRRTFAAMLTKLDDSVGKVVAALHEKEMLSNSIIIFTTDNGGPAAGFNNNAASNWPLRGVKASLWEGGVRGAGAIWSPLLKNPGRVSNHAFQVMDWLPTLIGAIGGNMSGLPSMDGKNLWDSIAEDQPSSRNMFLHNIDPLTGGAALRLGDWKLLYKPNSYEDKWNGWFGPSGRNYSTMTKYNRIKRIMKSNVGRCVTSLDPTSFENIKTIMKNAEVLCGPVPANATQRCEEESDPCLFHIPSDPCEYYDLSDQNPKIVAQLQALLNTLKESTVEPINQPPDATSNPAYWNYAWTNWKDYPSPLNV